MRIGIVSDTHGKIDRLRAAMRAFADRGVAAIAHCGDIGSAECLEALACRGAQAYAVVGNMDRRAEVLTRAAARCGVRLAWEVVEVPIGGEDHLVATHGHDGAVLEALIEGRQFPYVCHGHTHKRRDERIGPVRVINPGALHNVSVPTVAVLDTDTQDLEFVELAP